MSLSVARVVVVGVIAALALGCGRIGYDVQSLVDSGDGGGSGDASTRARDGSLPDGALPDGAALPTLDCQVAEVMFAPAAFGLLDPALSSDGLRLYARNRAAAPVETVVAVRASPTAAFGAWNLAPVQFNQSEQDFNFFEFKSQAYAMTARPSGGGRVLRLCDANVAACQPINLLEVSSGSPISDDDFDGPSVRVLSGDAAIMTFNSQLASGESLIWSATPDDDTLLTWRARPVLAFGGVHTVGLDDPGLSPDGELIVFNSGSAFFVARRQADGVTYAGEEPVSRSGDPTVAWGPEFGSVLADGSVELFFNSGESGVDQLYRTVCRVNQ